MSKFIIYAGRDYTADFTLVSNDGTTPQKLNTIDTGTITIFSSGPEGECILSNISLNLTDKDNGLFTVFLTAEQTAKLAQKLGFEEDSYSPIGNYEGFLDFNLVSGNRQALIQINVKEVPSCPIV